MRPDSRAGPLGPTLPTSFGRYTLLERVGGGGMASVYRASLSVDGGFEKEVAVKVVRSELAEDPQFTQMFLDEARLSARLTHANIVQTFDFGQQDGVHFLAMELVQGRTLAALLRICKAKGIRLGQGPSLQIATELARALGYAHRLAGADGQSLGVVHRDVSPQNVLISREGEVKLADFGIAKAVMRSHVTQPGRVRGKCAYMAPEQIRGQALDGRADVFALGIMLWESLTCRPLFEGPNDGAVLMQVLEKDLLKPSWFAPEVHPAVDEVVMRMLSRDRAERPDSTQVARGLADLTLRLVRSQAEIDLADLQRRLGSGTAVYAAMSPRDEAARVGEGEPTLVDVADFSVESGTATMDAHPGRARGAAELGQPAVEPRAEDAGREARRDDATVESSAGLRPVDPGAGRVGREARRADETVDSGVGLPAVVPGAGRPGREARRDHERVDSSSGQPAVDPQAGNVGRDARRDDAAGGSSSARTTANLRSVSATSAPTVEAGRVPVESETAATGRSRGQGEGERREATTAPLSRSVATKRSASSGPRRNLILWGGVIAALVGGATLALQLGRPLQLASALADEGAVADDVLQLVASDEAGISERSGALLKDPGSAAGETSGAEGREAIQPSGAGVLLDLYWPLEVGAWGGVAADAASAPGADDEDPGMPLVDEAIVLAAGTAHEHPPGPLASSKTNRPPRSVPATRPSMGERAATSRARPSATLGSVVLASRLSGKTRVSIDSGQVVVLDGAANPQQFEIQAGRRAFRFALPPNGSRPASTCTVKLDVDPSRKLALFISEEGGVFELEGRLRHPRPCGPTAEANQAPDLVTVKVASRFGCATRGFRRRRPRRIKLLVTVEARGRPAPPAALRRRRLRRIKLLIS